MVDRAFTAVEVFDGHRTRTNTAILVSEGHVSEIITRDLVPEDCQLTDFGAHLIAPGFVDLQVNGGGGVMFNNAPSAETIVSICAAHMRFGTTSLMVTLMTARPSVMQRAILAAVIAEGNRIPGFAGLHLEGPHLSPAKSGAHDASLMLQMTEAHAAEIIAAKKTLSNIVVTVAPENAPALLIQKLAQAGVIVSLGHSPTSYVIAKAAMEAGASTVTTLFNSMSALTHHEPGLTGAALDLGKLSAGLIADGVHVDVAAIRVAVKSKTTPGHIYLVTDAMATIGSTITSFEVDGRKITRRGQCLSLDDGTLAGSDIDMSQTVRFMINQVGTPRDEALRMASLYPARVLGRGEELGTLISGARADMVVLDKEMQVRETWIGGKQVHASPTASLAN